jgi:hypothetical protein
VNLVNDIDLVSAPHRRETNVLPEFANLIDAVVARAVDLKDVETETLRNLLT